jgi:hypothetical protein
VPEPFSIQSGCLQLPGRWQAPTPLAWSRMRRPISMGPAGWPAHWWGGP